MLSERFAGVQRATVTVGVIVELLRRRTPAKDRRHMDLGTMKKTVSLQTTVAIHEPGVSLVLIALQSVYCL